MRHVVALIMLAACELQPAPKKKPVPVEAANPPPPPQPQTMQPPAPLDGGMQVQPIQASAPCINVAAHVVQVFIDTAKDPAQAAVYEQERLKMTRATAEACERQAWSEAAQKCYLASKNPAAIKACENKFPPVPPAKGSGAGSAAPQIIIGNPRGTEAQRGSGAR
jgi:hypothetical protein